MAHSSQPKAEGTGDTLTADEMSALSARARVQAYPRNRVIIQEGDRSDSIFIIAAGRVRVFLQGEDGKEVVLNVHGPGEYFGEMVLDDGPRSASVVTLDDSQFYVVTHAEFRRFLSEHPDFAMKLINRLMRRVRALTENVRNLALLDVYGRVARVLLALAVEEEGRLVVSGKITQKDIADRVGASREMVSRVFKELVAGGYVTLEARRIVINRELPSRW